MKKIRSADGTTIAFDQSGQGPAVILVGGALEQRAMNSETAKLVSHLEPHFTVFHYDRRGRGDSTDTLPFAVEREIEDIDALIAEAGGSAFLFGISSGAALALEASLKLGSKVKKLAMYEPPYNSEDTARQVWRDYRKQLDEVIAAGRKGDAVLLFMALVGLPPEHAEGMRQHPMWPLWEGVGQTLAYDAAALGDDASIPVEKAARLNIPTLVMDGENSYPFMHVAAEELARVIPKGRRCTLEGQTHEADIAVLSPVLIEFFQADAA